MNAISYLTLPSGNTYEIKDAYARQLLAAGLNFIICWDGSGTPDVSKIPAGVVVTYNSTNYTGTLAASAATPLSFYLVKVKNNVYTEYASVRTGGTGTDGDPYTYAWEALGDTSLDLSNLGALAYKDSVTLSKGDGAEVLGKNATFQAAQSSVSFAAHTTKAALGKNATFSVGGGSKTKTKISASASGTAVSTGTDSFVQSYPGVTSKLVKGSVSSVKTNTEKTIPNVTGVGSASTWSFAMGTGTDAETLIISGANGSAPRHGHQGLPY